MAIKKTIKTKMTVPPLNKKNAQKFGDGLYSVKDGVIQCLVMCNVELRNGKVGGRTTHCAVGEVYHTFVNPSLSGLLKRMDPTASAIEAIARIAKLKDDSAEGRIDLKNALNTLVDINDVAGEDLETEALTYLARAEQVQQTWREQVIPLLK